jgi:hypothetical protein
LAGILVNFQRELTTISPYDMDYDIWNEKYVLNFYKNPDIPVISNVPDSSIIVDTTIHLDGHPKPLSVSQNPSTFEVKVEWTGETECYLDYLTIENYPSYVLHNHGMDVQIHDGIYDYVNYPAVLFYKFWDEPEIANLLPIRYTNRLVSSYFSNFQKGGLAFNYKNSSQRYLAQTDLNIERCDFYGIDPGIPIPGENNYLDSIQSKMNWYLIPHAEDAISHCNSFEKVFWLTPQAHEWLQDPPHQGEIQMREPSAYEIKLQTNLGIAFGAKGIQYYLYAKPLYPDGTPRGYGFLDDDGYGNLPLITPPIPRYIDRYGYQKWNIIKNLNAKIASQGNMLMSLTWDSSYYIHDTLPSGKYITNVQSYYTPQMQIPNYLEPHSYTQLSLFKNSTSNLNEERFFVLNRRTLPDDQRVIKVTYNKSSTNPNSYQNWTIREVGTNNYWSDGVAGFFQTTYDPAEGKLFTLEPTVNTGGDLITNETISGTNTLSGALSIKPNDTLTLSSNSTYNINNNITIDSGGVFVINQGATLNFQNGASLVVRGNLIMDANAKLNIYGENSIILYGHINCSANLNIPIFSTLELHQGSVINLNSNDTLRVNGTLSSGFDSGTSTINGGVIIFSGRSASRSSLKYCSLFNSAGIQCLNNASVTIENDSIMNSINSGIYVYNASPQINDNYIYNPLNNGIWCQSTSFSNGYWLGIQRNTIIKDSSNINYHHYQGIWIESCDGAMIGENKIKGFDWGNYNGNSCVFLWSDNPDRSNLFTSNKVGLAAGWGTSLFAGYKDGGFCDHNSFHANINYNIFCYAESWAEAAYDYWGGGHKSHVDETSAIDFYPMTDLNTDPWGGQNLAIVKPSNNSESVNYLNKPMGSVSSSTDNLSTGLWLEKTGRIDDAINFYKGLITNDKYVRIALSQLVHIKNKYAKSEIADYFGSLSRCNQKYYPMVNKLLGDMYLKNDQFDEAIAVYDNVIIKYPADYDGISARFEKLFAYLHVKNDPVTASKILSEIKGTNSKDAEVQLLIESTENLIVGNYKGMKKSANLISPNCNGSRGKGIIIKKVK